MTAMSKRRIAVFALLAGLTLGACGSTAATSGPASTTPAPSVTAAPTATPTPVPTASPTPAPTASPTPTPMPTATPSPSPDPSQGAALFKFAPSAVIAYYKGVGFKCGAENTALTGYVIQQCFKTAKNAPTSMISIAWSTTDGTTQYGYAGYYNKDGAKKPAAADSGRALGTFIGALLGTDDGTAVGNWFSTNFGTKATETYKGLVVYSYPLTAKPGSGYFFEISTPEFQKAISG